MHRPDVLEKLGATAPVPFTGCSNVVSSEFSFNFDKWSHPTQYYVSNLLDRGIRVLLYAGTYDWQCNWVANKLWSDKLEWSGAEGYAAEQWRDWSASNATNPAGQTKSWGPLTFATVYAAGHMMSLSVFHLRNVVLTLHPFYVPFDKPQESFEMVSRWIAGKALY